MPAFRYRAIDAQGQPVAGEIEAPDWTSAAARLAQQGLLRIEADSPSATAPSADAADRLTAEQSAELVTRIADLSHAGLPLSAGLYALADELGPGRLARSFRTVAARLDRGEPLETVIQAAGQGFPADIHGLLVAAARSGRLSESLYEFLQLRSRNRVLWRRVGLAVAYPLLLLALLLALFLFFATMIVPDVAKMLEDFAIAVDDLPLTTRYLLELRSEGVWLGLAGVLAILGIALWLARGWAVTWRVISWVPLFGPMGRFAALAQCCRMTALLLKQQMGLPEALRLTAAGLADADLATGCREAAGRLEAGQAPAECFFAQRQFPVGLAPMVDWGQRAAALDGAMEAAGEVYQGRAETLASLLESVVGPLMFAVVVGGILLLLLGIYRPLGSFIEYLSYTSYTRKESAVAEDDKALLGSLALIGFAVALQVALRIMAGRTWRNDVLQSRLGLVAWCLLAIGTLSACVLLLSWLGLFVFAVLVAVVLWMFWQGRLARQRAILGVLRVAVDRLMPLLPAAEAFADEQRGAAAVQARQFAAELRAGRPLAEALGRTRGLISPGATAAIGMGQMAGALPQGLRQALAAIASLEPVWASLAKHAGYLGFLLVVGLSTVIYLLFRVVPAFQKIFEDFEAELPPLTKVIIAFSNFVAQIGAGLLVIASVLVGLAVVYVVTGRLGAIPPFLPGGRMLRRLDTANLLESLALVVEQGKPLSDGIRWLVETYHHSAIRSRLLQSLDYLEHGAPWIEALRRTGLIRETDGAVLQAAERVGNLPWAMRELAGANRRRLAYRLRAWIQVAFTAGLCMAAVVVAVFVVGMFLPLVSLIERLTVT